MSVFGTSVRLLLGALALVWLAGCTAMAVTGAVVGTATAVVVQVVEVPFEVAGGIRDALTDDKDEARETLDQTDDRPGANRDVPVSRQPAVGRHTRRLTTGRRPHQPDPVR